MRLLLLFFILSAVYSGYACYACPVNETLHYVELNRSLDFGFEAYIDLPFVIPNVPHHMPALTQLNSSLFIHIQNNLNGSFYIYELDAEAPKLFQHTWSGPLSKRITFRIISMFPSTVYSNVSTLYSYCLPTESLPLDPKTINVDPRSIPLKRKDHIWLIGLVVFFIFVLFMRSSATVPASKQSK